MTPGFDGLKFCREVWIKNVNYYVYIILINARNTCKDIVIALEGGIDDFFAKPLNLDELSARITIGARIVSLESELNQTYLTITRNYYQTLRLFTRFLETYDADLGGHNRRVGRLL